MRNMVVPVSSRSWFVAVTLVDLPRKDSNAGLFPRSTGPKDTIYLI